VLYVTLLLAGMTFWLFEFELSRGMSLERHAPPRSTCW